MRKIAVIFLVLLLLSLSGIQGCPDLGGIKTKFGQQQEIVKLRGLSIEFEKGKPHLSSIEGESLGVIRVGEDFYVGLKVTNYVQKPVTGSISISNLAKYITSIKEEQSFSVEEAAVQDNIVYPGVTSVEFGPYIYDKISVKDKISDNLITEVNLNYNGLITADLCFNKEEENAPGMICNNNEILTENVLGGDSGALPVSVEKIEKEVIARGNEASFYLTINLRNFEQGYIEGNKFTSFNVNMIGNSIECNRDIVFRDNKAKVDCSGTVSFGDESFAKAPLEIDFSYTYKIIKTMNYAVM